MNAHISKSHCAMLFFCFMSACSIIIGTLIWVQIIHHAFYTQCGERQYFFTITEYPPRAPIMDRTGTNYLALNTESIAAFIVPDTLQNKTAVEAFLRKHFPDAYIRLMRNEHKKFMYVGRKLTQEQQDSIKNAHLEDIHFLQEPSRFYPIPAAACIIGITDIDNNGLFGIEKLYDATLKGKAHVMHVEKDARSECYVRKEIVNPGYNGTPVTLTIDSTLQFLVHEAVANTMKKFGAQRGAALIMDSNGKILAIVNIPNFDPHHTEQLNLEYTKIVCISDVYELGSVFKVFSALAALEEQVVTPDELIDCKNSTTTYINGRRINTILPHGIIPFVDVVAFSNNIGIALVTQRLGPKLYDHYRKLGFGSKTGIELIGEASGFVNHPDNWSKQSCISLSYGYEVTATLLQLAGAFALIARDGVPIQPHIILNQHAIDHANNQQPIYSAMSIAVIKDILRRTTQYGTARKAQVHGCTVMSKTGTANMLIDGTYVPTKNRYTCAGIVEKEGYQRIIVTFIQEADRGDLFAATVTAPLFEEIAERMLMHEQMVS